MSRRLRLLQTLSHVSWYNTWEIAADNLEWTREKTKQRYDLRARQRVFQLGQKVLVFLPQPGHPLTAKFFGPYTIKKVSDTAHVVVTPDRRRAQRLCHINSLQSYEDESTGATTLTYNTHTVLSPAHAALTVLTPTLTPLTLALAVLTLYSHWHLQHSHCTHTGTYSTHTVLTLALAVLTLYSHWHLQHSHSTHTGTCCTHTVLTQALTVRTLLTQALTVLTLYSHRTHTVLTPALTVLTPYAHCTHTGTYRTHTATYRTFRLLTVYSHRHLQYSLRSDNVFTLALTLLTLYSHSTRTVPTPGYK